jgi:hypothetical protein
MLIAVCTISPARYIHYGVGALLHSSENWRTPVEIINQEESNVPVLLYSGLIEADQWHDSPVDEERRYCEMPLRGLYPIDEQQSVVSLGKSVPLSLSAEMRASIESQGTWLVVRGTNKTAARVQQKVLSTLGNEFGVTRSEDFGGVHLRRVMQKP